MSIDIYKKESLSIIEKEGINSPSLTNLIDILLKDSRLSYIKLGNSLLKKIEKFNEEIDRVKKLYEFDILNLNGLKYAAGVDEVGRGPLAGPIVSASVVLDLTKPLNESMILGINDSKKLSPKERERLSLEIKEKAICYSIAEASNLEIDSIGIGPCNHLVFRKAIGGLKVVPNLVLSDGYKVKGLSIDNKAFVKGDAKSASIACSSIVAKVYRDNLMKEYSVKYPQYGFYKNAGYGTKEHIDAIKKYGITDIHRKSFLKSILD